MSITAAQSLKRSYFLLTASKDHLMKGIEHGFVQQKRPHRIEKIKQGDCVVFYASKENFGDKKGYQKILGWACALDDDYEEMDPKTMAASLREEDQFGCSSGTTFYRKKMEMHPASSPIDLRPLLPRLHFVKNKKSWSFYFMSGF